MPPEVRRGIVIFSCLVTLVAVIWAARMDYVPPAHFSLQNGTDPKTLDPHRATGQPESKIIFELFEGLLRMLPEGSPDPKTGLQPLTPQPGMATSYEVSEDGKTYTFHLRDGLVWTDGTPLTAHDFAWSWQRMLHPATACEYGYLISEVVLADEYHHSIVKVGDRVEVELWDRPGESSGSDANIQHFPRGTMKYGTLRAIIKPDQIVLPDSASDDARESAELDWQESWVYQIDVAPSDGSGNVDWDGPTTPEEFSVSAQVARDDSIQRTHGVMVDFQHFGGAQAVDDQTFVVRLNNAVPYFLNLVAYYPLFPVNRNCIETHGAPLWTKAENIVTNGPYMLQFRRLRDRIRVAKNPDYHNVDSVGMETIDFISLESQNTALNMYETGQIQWAYDLPTSVLEELKDRPDFHSAPKLSIYFYKLNHDVPPLDDIRVRQALSMAINRRQIVEEVSKGGQQPAYSVVPPGIAGYDNADGLHEDVARAKELLAEAGYPGGRGFPKISLLYNTSETHRPIAEVIQQQLQNNLNIKIELKNMEWGSFTETVQMEKYEMARYGWVGDYPDPNTFLDMWVTDNPQSNTNWSNLEYDGLIKAASTELDSTKRMQLLRQAETILANELPVIPIYFYTSAEMAKTNIEGFAPSAQDLHPLQILRYRSETPKE
ncbi:peptide ABC transporter substrate-binding protein [Stieleria sp. TO1_6]|uniref:peptide ABC transporter substrate-binding protein n=1 Tax=Stieleria tagensis TaxID=2956795 RepID=UPI00209B4F08|nr:peptide ABC transporter substrate-binding protein [Stieleria tagensis]MCO8120793.1 peptide ABC transporter substrate-binding protein [Stieleria tagensis]